MVALTSPTELESLRSKLSEIYTPDLPCITVCGGTGCRVYGSEKVWEAFRQELATRKVAAGLTMDVKVTGCHGFCEKGPLVVIRPQGIFYSHVKVEDVPEIITETILGGKLIERLLIR